MKIVFDTYEQGTPVPVQEHLRNRKLAKYFNREAAAALVCAARLFRNTRIDAEIPFYYETGTMEFEDYGLDNIVNASLDKEGNFSQWFFVEKGMKAVMPLTQFKALYNMPLSLVSIELGLVGDNAVIYASARGLLVAALHAPREKGILLGCGKVSRSGSVEAAFALVDKDEIRSSPFLSSDEEGMEMFRTWRLMGSG
ncbi:MAG TPA: hypothetical protein VN604_09135 [Nitrospirota bacterium]|nr:hypothetical protein [Nitrospirota bacterium]